MDSIGVALAHLVGQKPIYNIGIDVGGHSGLRKVFGLVRDENNHVVGVAQEACSEALVGSARRTARC